jgi:hypothetical protein
MTLTAQSQINGNVAITEEPSIRQIMDHRKSLNFDNKRKIKAWSVQISLTRDKYQATKKVSEVKNQYKHLDHEIDWFYENPYYRLYTGAFYTKIEAASLLHQLVEDYPSAIIFKNNQVKPNILK